MKRLYIISVFLLTITTLFAQRNIRPDWLLEKPQDGRDYVYVVEHGVGLDEQSAYQAAMQHVHESYTNRLGQAVVSSDKGYQKVDEVFNVPFKKVCEYTIKQTDGTYCVYVLVQVAKSGAVEPHFDDYRACNSITKYKSYMQKKNATALTASIFLPGVGQMTKRHYTEGVFTLLGEGALIGGGVAMLSLSNKQKTIMNDISGTVDYDTYMNAKSKYNTYRYTAYGLFGGAAVLYGINLWRAWACNYRFKEIAFYPTLMPEPSPTGLALGVGMNVNF